MINSRFTMDGRTDPLSVDDLTYDSMYTQNPNDAWDNIFQVEPLWMREAAKQLNSNHINNDWIALAKRLSYSDRDISKFAEEISPSLALLKDWYESNGRTRYCIDVLVSCLRMLSRDDIASLIEYELEPESTPPPIFLSYQRDSQKQVLGILIYILLSFKTFTKLIFCRDTTKIGTIRLSLLDGH